MAKIITVVSIVGSGPSYTLEIDSSSGILSGDYASDHVGHIYRVVSIGDATHIDIIDDVAPDAPVGLPVIGTGSIFSPTSNIKLSQAPFTAPAWDEIIRHDARTIDSYVASIDNVTAGAGLTGGGDLPTTLNVAANVDGSIVVNTNDVQVGVLASDAQHGIRGGGTQHAAASLTNAGFMEPFENLTRQLWVDTNTALSLSEQDGSVLKPFKLVQSALDVLNAAPSGSVYHIRIGFGNYSAESLIFQPNRRVLLEGPIQGATILGNITYNCTGASTTTLAMRNVASGVTTVVDSGTPATAANLILENCRTNGVITAGSSIITLVVAGTTQADFNFPTLVVASTVNGNLNVIGPIFCNNTLFTSFCTQIDSQLLFCTGSSFGSVAFNFTDVISSFFQCIFRAPCVITFTGAEGEITMGEPSTASFVDSGSTTVNCIHVITTQRNTGWLSGGVVTRGTGFDLNVAAGSGYIFQNDDITYYITWPDTIVTLPSNSLVTVYANNDGDIVSAPFPFDLRNGVVLAVAQTNGSSIVALTSGYLESTQIVPQFAAYARDVVGPIHVDGLATTINGTNALRLDVDAGSYYLTIQKMDAVATSPITFTYWYMDGIGGFTHIGAQTTINTNLYDDGSGTLAALPAGKFAKDLLFVTVHDTSITEYHIVYAQEYYDSQSQAESGNLPSPPSVLTHMGLRIAGVVYEQAAIAITSITDERPRLGQLASGSTSVNDHGLLAGLGDDDHGQYQLRSEKNMASGYAGLSGGSKLTGSQQVYGTTTNTATEGNDARVPSQAENDALQGTNGVPSNTNRYVTDSDPRNSDNRAPTLHAASHLPGGTDALTTSVPGSILPDDTPGAGSAASFSRSDHRHGITTAAASNVGDANAEGSASSFARSDHIHKEAHPILIWGDGNISATTTTRYLSPGYADGTALTSPIQFRVPSSGSVRRLRVRHNTTAGNGNAVVYTVRINSIASAVTVSMASTAADGSDLANTAAVVAGDLIDIEITKAASIATSPSDVMASLEVIP